MCRFQMLPQFALEMARLFKKSNLKLGFSKLIQILSVDDFTHFFSALFWISFVLILLHKSSLDCNNKLKLSQCFNLDQLKKTQKVWIWYHISNCTYEAKHWHMKFTKVLKRKKNVKLRLSIFSNFFEKSKFLIELFEQSSHF